MHNNLYLIVAIDKNHGIGKNGMLPWDLKGDLQYFQDITTKTQDENKNHAVIMGRTTWESIPEPHRPLKKRKNYVLTRNKDYKQDGAHVAHSLEHSFEMIDENIEDVFIIGGGKLFEESIHRDDITGLYITHIHQEFDCDTFFPQIPSHFQECSSLGKREENGIPYEFKLYRR